MIFTTREQRLALKLVYDRIEAARKPSQRRLPYRQFRKSVAAGPDCIMVPFAGMWLGIEKDGYTHS
jgi:hypothetical protein